MVNGLGMGNSTRCYAVMEHLIEAGVRVHVLTSGNGLAFFQNKEGIESVIPMPSFFYSGQNGGVSGWRTFKTVPALARIAREKSAHVKKVVAQVEPNIA